MDARFPYLYAAIALVAVAIVATLDAGQAPSEADEAKRLEDTGGLVDKADGTVRAITLRPHKPTDFATIDFSAFKNLRLVMVRGGQVTDGLIEKLQAIPPGLEVLDVILAPVTDKAIVPLLKKQPSLKVVSLSATKISDKTVAELGKLKELHSVWLDETQITDKGLRHLAPLPITHISAHATAISDAGLAALKDTTTLRTLFVEETKVTDVGLRELFGLHSLRLLGVDSTDVSDDGRKAIKAAIPSLEFHKYPKRN
jgi:hypothetical protein